MTVTIDNMPLPWRLLTGHPAGACGDRAWARARLPRPGPVEQPRPPCQGAEWSCAATADASARSRSAIRSSTVSLRGVGPSHDGLFRGILVLADGQGELEDDRGRIAQQVEDGAVAIDRALEPGDRLGRFRTVDVDGAPDRCKAGPNARIDAEEPPQVEVTLETDGDVVDPDPERVGVQAVGDLLARGERGERQLDGIRPLIATGERRRLVDVEPEVADRDLAMETFDLAARDPESRVRGVGRRAQDLGEGLERLLEAKVGHRPGPRGWRATRV